jgi:hypothetical protein
MRGSSMRSTELRCALNNSNTDVPPPMRELMTIETFNVTGRGVAHVVHVGETAPALHEHILLDGHVCEVTGVEWPIRNGHTAIVVAEIIE